MQFNSEFEQKKGRVAQFLDRERLDGVVLSTQANFAWFTCGGDNHVNIAQDTGVGHLVVTRDRIWLICDNIEDARFRDEEVGKFGIEVQPCNWWEGGHKDKIDRLVGSSNWASDSGAFGSSNIEAAFAPIRYSLMPEEIERYRAAGQAVARCMDEACRSIEPGMSEFKVGSILNGLILANGMIPFVTLIAADERITKYRHPIPTDKTVKKHVMLVTGTRYKGLMVSMSRLVYFGSMPEELRRKHIACLQVDAALIHNTRVGNSISDIFKAGVKAYADAGFPDEWKLHHQGGPAGYRARDFRASLTVDARVQQNQAFAWNPTITGTKSEDTIIALPDRTEILSEIPGWPMVDVTIGGETLRRPDILQR